MSVFGNTASLGGITFNMETQTARQELRTKKQAIGKVLVQNRVLGQTTLQKRLSIRGSLTAATRDSDRVSLEGFDDGVLRAFVDGHNDGNYIIVRGGLIFDDNSSTVGQYNFTLELVEA